MSETKFLCVKCEKENNSIEGRIEGGIHSMGLLLLVNNKLVSSFSNENFSWKCDVMIISTPGESSTQ